MAFGEASAKETCLQYSELAINVHIGQRIRLCRINTGMTEEELGDVAGLDEETIQQCESARILMSPDTLWKIANGLGQPIDYFYEGLRRAS
jgi:transcriptional regulator with XRE-family HTH domain